VGIKTRSKLESIFFIKRAQNLILTNFFFKNRKIKAIKKLDKIPPTEHESKIKKGDSSLLKMLKARGMAPFSSIKGTKLSRALIRQITIAFMQYYIDKTVKNSCCGLI